MGNFVFSAQTLLSKNRKFLIKWHLYSTFWERRSLLRALSLLSCFRWKAVMIRLCFSSQDGWSLSGRKPFYLAVWSDSIVVFVDHLVRT